MQTETLNLSVGTMVQIQATYPENSPRYNAPLVGYKDGASLIVQTPSVNGNIQLIREGQIFTVRMLHGESLVAFVAKVICTTLKPFPHFHLQYPKEFEHVIVRNAMRVGTKEACMVRLVESEDTQDNYRRCDITDLSENGAKVDSLVPIGEADEEIQVNFRLTVLNEQEELSLKGDIMNVSEKIIKNDKERHLVHTVGVRFKDLTRFQTVCLHAWTMNHAMNGGKTSEGK